MINLIKPYTGNCYIAFSGGIDSVCLTHYLIKNEYKPHLLFFNHNTKEDFEAEIFIKKFADKHSLNLTIELFPYRIESNKESIWREARYNFLNKFIDKDIYLAHHLDDAIETYLIGVLQGSNRNLSYHYNNRIKRPMLLNTKEDIIKYTNFHNLEYYEDINNSNTDYLRIKIRKEIFPFLNSYKEFNLERLVRKQILKNLSIFLSAL